jgi:hypothetical protein
MSKNGVRRRAYAHKGEDDGAVGELDVLNVVEEGVGGVKVDGARLIGGLGHARLPGEVDASERGGEVGNKAGGAKVPCLFRDMLRDLDRVGHVGLPS